MEQPLLIPVPGGYLLTQQYRYTWQADNVRYRITIPSGFQLDGASVPRILWTVTGITPDGLHRPAALLHDFIYRHHGRIPTGSMHRMEAGRWVVVEKPNWTRIQADQLFARILREVGVGKFRRRLMFIGVRLAGWASW